MKRNTKRMLAALTAWMMTCGMMMGTAPAALASAEREPTVPMVGTQEEESNVIASGDANTEATIRWALEQDAEGLLTLRVFANPEVESKYSRSTYELVDFPEDYKKKLIYEVVLEGEIYVDARDFQNMFFDYVTIGKDVKGVSSDAFSHINKSVSVYNPNCILAAGSLGGKYDALRLPKPGVNCPSILGLPNSTAQTYAVLNNVRYTEMCGFDGDNLFDLRDVVALQKTLTGEKSMPEDDYALAAGDLNHDGVLNVWDLCKMKRSLLSPKVNPMTDAFALLGYPDDYYHSAEDASSDCDSVDTITYMYTDKEGERGGWLWANPYGTTSYTKFIVDSSEIPEGFNHLYLIKPEDNTVWKELRDDGTDGDEVAGDGIYTTQLSPADYLKTGYIVDNICHDYDQYSMPSSHSFDLTVCTDTGMKSKTCWVTIYHRIESMPRPW